MQKGIVGDLEGGDAGCSGVTMRVTLGDSGRCTTTRSGRGTAFIEYTQ